MLKTVDPVKFMDTCVVGGVMVKRVTFFVVL